MGIKKKKGSKRNNSYDVFSLYGNRLESIYEFEDERGYTFQDHFDVQEYVDYDNAITELSRENAKSTSPEGLRFGVPKVNNYESVINDGNSSDIVALADGGTVAAPAEQAAAQPTEKPSLVSEYRLARLVTDSFCAGMYSGTPYIRLGENYVPATTQNVGSALDGLGETAFTMKGLPGVIQRIATFSEVIARKLTVSSDVVYATNGYFCIRTGQRVEPDPNTIYGRQLDACFVPGTDDGCPVFDGFLYHFSGGDSSVEELLVAVLGYMLLPGTPAKHMFFMGYAPHSGKSTISRFIQRVLGDASTSSLDIQDFANDFKVAQLVGRTANFGLDVAGGQLNKHAVAKIKTLTGNDSITVNAKYEPTLSHKCYAKLLFCGNEPFYLSRYDEAFYDRLICIPADYSIPEDMRDFHLEEHLYAERDQIVTRCLLAVGEVARNNWIFPYCEASVRMKEELKCTGVPYLREFINSCCRSVASSFTGTAQLYEAYIDFTGSNSVSLKKFQNAFGALTQYKADRHQIDGKQYRGFWGVDIIN